MNESAKLTRRTLLTAMGTGAAIIALNRTGLDLFVDRVEAASPLFSFQTKKLSSFASISAVEPSKLTIPKGFTFDLLDATKLVLGRYKIGNSHSYCKFIPDGSSNVKGVIWISHGGSSNSDLQQQGGTLLEVYRDVGGGWKINLQSPFNQRLTGYDACSFSGPALKSKGLNGATKASGIIGNQFGGHTPWKTVLSGENNIEDICLDNGLDFSHYGWVAEIDPTQGKNNPVKHTALGRFRHGAIEVMLSKKNKVVVYMGSDEMGGCLFKFISEKSYSPKNSQMETNQLLTSGTLYALNVEDGKWLPLTIEAVQKKLSDIRAKLPYAIRKTKEQLKAQFQEQADVLIYAQEAALLVGATPLDRPSGIKYHAPDQALYISQTNNLNHGNLHGSICKLVEKDRNLESTQCVFDAVSIGGSTTGYSSPASIYIDSLGNTWFTTSLPDEKIGQGSYQSFKNNSLYMINVKGKINKFAAVPSHSEIIGFSFTPDERTLFITIRNHKTKKAEIAAVRGF